jgi:hypothetical protein
MTSNTVAEQRRKHSVTNGGLTTRESSVAVYDHMQPVSVLDRVRWASIFAGLVIALSVLVLQSVLGLAIGLTTYEAGDQLGNFGIGAGVWGAISTIVAFVLGGWVAARTAAVHGRGNAILNGGMVWAVAIPLILYLLGSGVGSLMNMATDVAATSAAALAEEVTATDASAAAESVQAQAQQIDPTTVENVAQDAGNAAWGTLIGLLLGLVAAVGGGLMGQRREEEIYRDVVVT